MVMPPFARQPLEVQDQVEIAIVPGRISHTVRKHVWDATQQQFTPQVYVRLNLAEPDAAALQHWLEDQYGPPRYHGAWWRERLSTRLMGFWMREQISSFWFLSQGR